MVPKPFKKKYYDGKYSHSTFYMPKAIQRRDQNKGERKAQSQRQ